MMDFEKRRKRKHDIECYAKAYGMEIFALADLYTGLLFKNPETLPIFWVMEGIGGVFFIASMITRYRHNKCPYCNAHLQYPTKIIYCSYCGKRIGNPEVPKVQKYTFLCPYCGEELSERYTGEPVKCPHCKGIIEGFDENVIQE